MIKLKNRSIGISDGRVTAYTALRPQSGPSRAQYAPRMETASGANITLSAAGSANTANQDGFLTGLIQENGSLITKALRDMYMNDAICGSAVDLQSELPFSNFSLFGVEPDRLDVYESAIAQLNMRAAAPSMTRHYMVDGMYAATLVFDKSTATFRDQIPYSSENLKLDYVPLVSQDPVITAQLDGKYKDFFGGDKKYAQLAKLIPAPLAKALREGDFVLDPLSTLFMARRPFFNQEPVSYLRRCLPAYLMEKTLYRGTLFEAGRRQRANVHVTAGDEYWEPTPEELGALANVFQQTDLDPMGAIVVTRNAINLNEWRPGGDFWKWTDVFDVLTTIKLKALGISDAFLSSESTYSNADNALVVFMENQNAYRDYFTHVVFINKLFPLIAMLKGFHKKDAHGATDNSAGQGVNLKSANDHSKLDIPKVRWHKRLTAGNDTNMFETLESLTERGVPVPIRLWLAAANIDPENLVNELADDDKLKQKLDEHSKHLQPEGMGMLDGGGGEGGWGGEEASLRTISPFAQKVSSLSSMDWGNLGDAHTEDSTGKRHYAMNQRAAHRKINERIARRAAALACDHTYARIRQDLVRAGMLKGK